MTLKEQWIAFKTILIKEIVRFCRIWIQTILPPVITIALYFIIFGNLIGSQIEDIEGFRYIEFLVPGLIMLTIISNCYANVVSSFYSAKFQRHIEEMLVSPMPNYIIVLGFTAGGVVRGLAVGLAVTITSLFFTHLHIDNLALTILVALLTSILFSIAGLINAIFANSFDDISLIPTFVLTPLTYLGGIFYSIDMLPEIWQKISLANPILYMVNTFREGMLGISDIDTVYSFIIIGGFIIALYLFCLYLLKRGVGIRS